MPLDLSAIRAAAIAPDAVRRLHLPQLGITLHLRPATEENPAYWNAFIATQTEYAQRVSAVGGTPTPDMAAARRRQEVDLFATHVLVGWEGVKRSDGTEATFDRAGAVELLTSIVESAPRFWGQIDRFASAADHYSAKAIAAAEALAGNSSGG